MNATLPRLLAAASVFCAMLPALRAQTTPVYDTLFLTNGEHRIGRVTGIDATSLRLSVPLDPANPAVMASTTVPRNTVDHIEFAPNEARDKQLQSPTGASAPALAQLWAQWQSFLTLPKSPAGEIGIAYGNILVKDPATAGKALDLFSLIEKDTWDDDLKMLARQGRLRALIATGQAAKAIDEARELAKVSEDPAVLIEAKYIMAVAADSSFRQLVEENPRWQQDLNILPERNRLYAEALNLYLYPYLFFGSEVEPAARGLTGALGIYQFTGEEKLARETAQDIVTIYPGTKYAADAQKYLDSLPKAKPSTAPAAPKTNS